MDTSKNDAEELVDRLPPLEVDPVIEAYKKDVDRTLLRENLKLTPTQRLAQHAQMQRFVERFRGVAKASGSRGHRPSQSS